MTDTVSPIRLTLEETNEVFTLEFSRETVIWTNNHGFARDSFYNNPEEMLPILFYGSFRMHHKSVSRNKTDHILFDVLDGLSTKAVERLIELYNAPRNALIRDDDDESVKNCKATVEL